LLAEFSECSFYMYSGLLLIGNNMKGKVFFLSLLFFFVVLGIELGALSMLGRHPTTKLCPQL
jgi:hypothetical protein